MKKISFTFILGLLTFSAHAQIGINTTAPDAQLDIRSSNQAVPTNTDGVLIPKIDTFPATNPTAAQQGMLVYLTTVSGSNAPGFYYWNNPTVAWIPILSGTATAGTLDNAYDFGGPGAGRTITADTGAVTINGTDGLVSIGTLNSGALAPTGAGVKMFWNPRKAAFRSGVSGASWDDANLGFYSTAFGYSTTASGNTSTAFGSNNVAGGENSTAFGFSTNASGDNATAFGYNTDASGISSTAFGLETLASVDNATAFGFQTLATGSGSTAFGIFSEASGSSSLAFGRATSASGNLATAWGEESTASGHRSTAFGYRAEASSISSTAFGDRTTASAISSTAFGYDTTASGVGATAFGYTTEASGEYSTAFGLSTNATGIQSTAFGSGTFASGVNATAFGGGTNATGNHATSSGLHNWARSHSETVLGIGATNYTLSTNGDTQFRTANAVDRLFVVGNAIDANWNNAVDAAERRDALVILKNGLTRLPSTTNAMITAADGKAVVTKEFLQSSTSGTLDQAYDFGGVGVGRTITADAGAVTIDGTDGLISTGTVNSGATMPAGANVKMVWNPRKGAFRAGRVMTAEWDDANTGTYSAAFGFNTTSSGTLSMSFGNDTTASGYNAFASGEGSVASATLSNVFGYTNTSRSFGETVFGIGATNYTASVNGATQFRAANATDRLFVVGNAIDANNNFLVDAAERSDALVILKNGLTGIGRIPTTNRLEVNGTASKTVAGDWLANSDSRLKKNIETLNTKEALDKLLSLRGVTYEWDDRKTGIVRPEGTQLGFVAQEIQKVFPEKVTEDNLGYLQTGYGDYDPVYVQAIKEMVNRIEILERDNKLLKSQLQQQAEILERVTRLEAKVE